MGNGISSFVRLLMVLGLSYSSISVAMPNVHRRPFCVGLVGGAVSGYLFRALNSEVPETCSLGRFNLVVAHYDEDLSWLEPYGNKAHVFHKGSVLNPNLNFEILSWKKLDNVGRESHTYLKYIVDNYEMLADVTFFLQAGWNIHAHERNLASAYQRTVREGFTCLGGSLILAQDNWSQKICSKCSRPVGSFSEFWLVQFSEQHPEVLRWCVAANFAVRRDLIKRHPKEFYKRLMVALAQSSNPEEGHYLERMWYFIFDPQNASKTRNLLEWFS